MVNIEQLEIKTNFNVLFTFSLILDIVGFLSWDNYYLVEHFRLLKYMKRKCK